MALTPRTLTVLLVTLVALPAAALSGDDERPGAVTVALWGPFGRPGAEPGRLGRQMRAAADLAVSAADERLGVRLRIVAGSEDGAWGAGSRRLVDLVYRERAIAIVGPTDPGSAHLGLQLATRARIPLLCPAPPDPSLTRAGTPWIFSLLPDTRTRASAVARLIEREGWSSVRAVFQASRAGRAAERAVREEARRRGLSIETVLTGLAGEVSTESTPGPSGRCDAVLVWSEMPGEDAPARLVERWSRRGQLADMEVVFSGPLGPPAELDPLEGWWVLSALPETVLEGSPSLPGGTVGDPGAGDRPDPVALATYDALWLLALTIAEGHREPLAVRDHLAGLEATGVTGPLSFRGDGSRDRNPGPLRFRARQWISAAPVDDSTTSSAPGSVSCDRAASVGAEPGRGDS